MSPRIGDLASTLLLFALVVASALAIVSNIDDRRQVFAAMQSQGDSRDRIDTHWRQLLLEQAARSAQVEVDSVAHQRLGMDRPQSNSTVLVTLK